MATVTVSVASGPVTGSKTFTGTDADIQALLNWAAATYANDLGATPTNAQILAEIATVWIAQLKRSVQSFQTTAPPPITLA